MITEIFKTTFFYIVNQVKLFLQKIKSCYCFFFPSYRVLMRKPKSLPPTRFQFIDIRENKLTLFQNFSQTIYSPKKIYLMVHLVLYKRKKNGNGLRTKKQD